MKISQWKPFVQLIYANKNFFKVIYSDIKKLVVYLRMGMGVGREEKE
jgi:hypothetical protein